MAPIYSWTASSASQVGQMRQLFGRAGHASQVASTVLPGKRPFFTGCTQSLNRGIHRNGDSAQILPSASVSSAGYPAVGGWEDGELHAEHHEDFAFAVVGDLHLDPANENVFAEGRDQILYALDSQQSGQETASGLDEQLQLEGECTKRMFQVGDLGGYAAKPGTQDCFDRALRFFDSIPLAKALILGNHDLEGVDFEKDEDNLQAWIDTFGQRHYWAMDCGSCVCIGLSTVQFRSAPLSCHEVFVDEAQVAWFQETLERFSDRNVFVFTHAPPMGSGLKVLQEIHVKNRCAWLNHSEEPSKFIDIVERNPQIKLWFSGHFHLSHNYQDSISVVGRCAFVQVGVIGEDSTRDGFRHTRMLKGNQEGYEVYTLDHVSGDLRLDLAYEYGSSEPPQPLPLPAPEELLCTPEFGFLCALDDCSLDGDHVQWISAGHKSLMSIQQNMLLEYDPRTRAAVGVVSLNMENQKVRLLDQHGTVLASCESDSQDDGKDATIVELISDSGEVQHLTRNQYGGFSQVFQHNKWLARRQAYKQLTSQARA